MSKAIIALDKSKSYRVYLTVSTDLVRDAVNIHKTSPVASAGLGRVITGAGLMGLMMKNPSDKLTMNFKGDGPAGQILATAYGDGRVKAYISNPNVDIPLTENGKLDVGGSLGIGELTVIKDIGLKEPYMGSIALVSGEIADDMTAYFFISEQQNTSVALGVKVEKDLSIGCAGGMIIQMLPDAEENVPGEMSVVDELEKMLDKMEPLTTIIEKVTSNAGPLSEQGILQTLLDEIFKDMPEKFKPEILEERDISWKCDCSRERLEQVLMTIGRDEMKSMIEEDGQAELQCHFCLKKYRFTKDDLVKIYEMM